MLRVAHHLPEQTLVIEKSEALIRRIAALPQTKDGYGLIHNDLHQKNFFVEGDRMTAFDFDDATYNYLVNDIAMPLYYALWWPPIPVVDRDEYAKRFMGNFMNGYAKENTIGAEWLRHMHDFMLLRHVILHVIFNVILDKNNLNERQQQMLHKFRNDIENDIPLTGLDFASL